MNTVCASARILHWWERHCNEWQPRRQCGANVVAVERQARFRTEILTPRAETSLRADDVLLVDVPSAARGEQPEVFSGLGLERLPLQGSYFTDQSQEVGMAEVILPPNSGLIGKSVIKATFRRKYIST